MSTIDNPQIIADLLERKGASRFNLASYGRHTTETIWEYVTGFGGKAWKLIYGFYPEGMGEQEASAQFLTFANIKPGTECHALLFRGELTKRGEAFLDAHREMLRSERLQKEAQMRRVALFGR